MWRLHAVVGTSRLRECYLRFSLHSNTFLIDMHVSQLLRERRHMLTEIADLKAIISNLQLAAVALVSAKDASATQAAAALADAATARKDAAAAREQAAASDAAYMLLNSEFIPNKRKCDAAVAELAAIKIKCDAAVVELAAINNLATPSVHHYCDVLPSPSSNESSHDIIPPVPIPAAAGKPRVLGLWDIENVGIPPRATRADVNSFVFKLYDVLEQLLGCSYSDADIEIIAAHNPRAFDTVTRGHFITTEVASALTAKRVLLIDVGGGSQAADNKLKLQLTDWLAAYTPSTSRRSVIFITGDGGFISCVAEAKRHGCDVGLLFCKHSVNDSLVTSFSRDRCRSWDSVVGADGALALAERQRKRDELRDSQRKHAERESASGRNPRPELEKTELCWFWSGGNECEHELKFRSCWFAHGESELRLK